MKQDRLDRIEKGMEEFFRGMQELREEAKEFRAGMIELRESQKKTDELFRRTDEQILELKESQKKTDEQILELKESQKKTDGHILELKESQKKTDEQFRKTEEQFRRTDKRLDEIGRQLGDLGLVQGEIAEDLFYRNVEYLFGRRKQRFGSVYRNLKKKGIAEYDIVAVDDERILVIEVKNKLDTRMVDRFVNDKLPKFRQAFPEYSDHRLLGGMGALVVKDAVGRYAEKAGLYVLTQSGDGGAMLINPKDFVAKEFL